jgi:hypothetical protein
MLCTAADFVKTRFSQTLRCHIFVTKPPTDKIKYGIEMKICHFHFFLFYDILNLIKISGQNYYVITASSADFSSHSMSLGGGGRGPVIGWPRIKRSLQSHVGGGGAIQDVQEHNLHQFDQQI